VKFVKILKSFEYEIYQKRKLGESTKQRKLIDKKKGFTFDIIIETV